MTCQECELRLGMGEDASEHLASCAECQWLAKELRLNSIALRELHIRPRLHWALAAATAAVVMAVVAWKINRVEKLTRPPVRVAFAPKATQPVFVPSSHKKVKRKAAHGAAPQQPLRVKMFTSDPDVVIYWIVDKKEGFE
jgi:hypothetical protein